MADDRLWRDVAIGVGLIGVAAYFLWPSPSIAVPAGSVNQALPDTTVPSIPPYLSANRPAYALMPPDDLGNIENNAALPLPSGLVRQADGSVTGGNWIGPNYVGSGVPILDAGSFNNAALPANPVAAASDCGCSG